MVIICFPHIGPIYLIFQYCCYGDLLNYLKTNSERYHKSVTDAFNKDRFSSLYHNLQIRKRQQMDNFERWSTQARSHLKTDIIVKWF